MIAGISPYRAYCHDKVADSKNTIECNFLTERHLKIPAKPCGKRRGDEILQLISNQGTQTYKLPYLYCGNNTICHNLGSFIGAFVCITTWPESNSDILLVPEGRYGTAHEDRNEYEENYEHIDISM